MVNSVLICMSAHCPEGSILIGELSDLGHNRLCDWASRAHIRSFELCIARERQASETLNEFPEA